MWQPKAKIIFYFRKIRNDLKRS
uniref:Uncharacterized protein n=1 Tax=Arundo donax TaxID=35708 RepID=A0A0A9G1M2_ARUDO